MPLPSREEFLATIRPNTTVRGAAGPPTHFRTACNHIICMGCVRGHLQTQHTCPNCSASLYEPPTEASDNHHTSANARPAAPPRMPVDNMRTDKEAMTRSGFHADTLTRIDFNQIQRVAIAAIFHTMPSLWATSTGLRRYNCGREWQVFAEGIREVLRDIDGREDVTVEYLEMWLDDVVHERVVPNGGPEPMYSGELISRRRFLDDVFAVVDKIVQEAVRLYAAPSSSSGGS